MSGRKPELAFFFFLITIQVDVHSLSPSLSSQLPTLDRDGQNAAAVD